MPFNIISQKKAITLMELLIAVSLIGLLSIGIWSIDLFSRHQLMTSDRRARAQNEASFALEHMAKEIIKAIGDKDNPAANTTAIDTDTAIRVYVDLAPDGQSPGDGQRGTEGDCWRAYRYRGAGASIGDRYQIWYYPDYINLPNSYEVIARKISYFGPTIIDNYVNIDLKSRYDPSTAVTIDNPQVEMRVNIKMPAFSTN